MKSPALRLEISLSQRISAPQCLAQPATCPVKRGAHQTFLKVGRGSASPMFGICRPNSIYIWPGSASLPINVESFGNGAMKLEWSSSLLNEPIMPHSPMSLRSYLNCGIVSPKRQADIFTASSAGCRNT